MTPDELAAIEARHGVVEVYRRTAVDLGNADAALATVAALRRSVDDVPALIATVRALRAEVATLRREALLRDAGITTTSTGDRA
jgi:hypothetical protein